ncbi:MAG: Gfo/Idh/MocA family oxidoreductase [Magnetococcales bacterium]|nr:Gfo/Idh/MocA family oxidoreductase [Magnetococcales bacterium]
MSKKNVGLIGYGYWGPNLHRNFAVNPGFRVAMIADTRPARLERARQLDANLQTTTSGEAITDHPEIDLVVIATPVASHYPLAKRAIQQGKHVLVEKPFCATTEEAEELVRLAKAQGVQVLVDYTYLFTGAVRMIQEIHQSGELGKISYYDSTRVNLGLFQPDVNVLWDLAPHDFAILDFLFGEEPILIDATGYCHVNPHLPDIVYITMHFASSMVAHFNLSWMSPVKVRRTLIGGDAKMLVWDDLNNDQKLKIYSSGITVQQEHKRSVIIPEYRIGDIFSPRVPNNEALAAMVEHCRQVIDGETAAEIGGDRGIRITRLLERTQIILDRNLETVAALRKGNTP